MTEAAYSADMFYALSTILGVKDRVVHNFGETVPY